MPYYSKAELMLAAAELRQHGYVVIPRDRHLVFSVNRSVSWLELSHIEKDPENLKRFNEHMDSYSAREIGIAMMEAGAITKEDKGYDKTVTRHDTLYRAGVILPRAEDDHR